MKSAALLLASGYEEGEAINIIDILRRLGIKLTILSCENDIFLTSYHDVVIRADDYLSNNIDAIYDVLILVGGPPNTDKLGSDCTVINIIKKHINAGSYIAAICSSAAKVLAKNNLLNNHHYVCCSDFYKSFSDGIYTDFPLVLDGKFITALLPKSIEPFPSPAI
ncbi:DJ-1/PfpI family protein [Vibrio artabrorum]|uniref:DJ-1/PfpI family protein n=1 Tax=Vibrio artabrorum TaxID=446374 RepID=A0ABT8CKT8_9VIBR|nr:DJ-1/PfpI family protein [Vibrio artabrorum]MDN3702308.1 DJ-1/PfpI family protein [Vibrio artabrorum]